MSPGTPVGRGPGRVGAFDGFRGLAVLAVLLFHGGYLTGGYLGVDAFFVLSGFLITALLLGEVASRGGVGLAEFWSRRARRLLPALFLFVLAAAAYARIARSDSGRVRQDAIGALLYVANWRAIFAGHGYFDLFRAPSPFDHTWSLAVEEQFYIVWPLVVIAVAALAVRAVRRTGRRDLIAPALGAVALLGAIASATWCIVHFDSANPSRVYLGTDTRIGAILLGAAVAAWLAWRGPARSHRARVVVDAVSVLAAAGLAVAWLRLDGQGAFLYRGGLVLCGIGVAAIILAVAQGPTGPVGRVLAWRPLVVLGLVSYGVYLWHWLAYLVLDEARLGIGGVALLAVRMGVTFALAAASYLWIERPMRHLPAPPRTVLAASAVGLVVCVAAVALILPGSAADAERATSGLLAGKARLHVGSGSHTGLDHTHRVLVVGDSVAGIVGGAAEEVAPALSLEAGTAAVPGCQLAGITATRASADGSPSTRVAGCEATWLEGVKRFAPGVIVVLYGVAEGFIELDVGEQWTDACSPTFRHWYVRALEGVLRRISADARVLLEVVPPAVVNADSDEVNGRIACMNAMHRAVARALPGVELADVAALACPGGRCRESIEGAEFRIDPVHYSAPAARYLARVLLEQAVPAPRAATSGSG